MLIKYIKKFNTSSQLDKATEEDWKILEDFWDENGVGSPEVTGLGT